LIQKSEEMKKRNFISISFIFYMIVGKDGLKKTYVRKSQKVEKSGTKASKV